MHDCVAYIISRAGDCIMAGALFPTDSPHPQPHTTNSIPHKTIIIRMISTAQTGFVYTQQRLRQGPRLSTMKYDPVGASCTAGSLHITVHTQCRNQFVVQCNARFCLSKVEKRASSGSASPLHNCREAACMVLQFSS